MSETRGLVKCVLGLLLVVGIIAGGLMGFDVKVQVADTDNSVVETTDEDVVVDTENTPADATPTEDVEQSVDTSEQDEVATPTDEQENTATEGDVE